MRLPAMEDGGQENRWLPWMCTTLLYPLKSLYYICCSTKKIDAKEKEKEKEKEDAKEKEEEEEKIVLNRDNCVVVFDLDQVLLDSNFLSVFWSNKRLMVDEFYKDPWFFVQVLKEAFHDVGAIEKYILLAQQANKKELVNFGWQLIGSKNLIPGTVKIMEQLLINGYRVFRASNMSTNEYQYLEDKFPLFQNFVGGLTVPYVAANSIELIRKPHREYYETLTDMILVEERKLHGNTKTTIVFVDDIWNNVESSKVACGWVGLHFISADQLQSDMIDLNLLSAPIL
jgi:FMN phosphatase YigB (HAD superfamily)